MESLALSVPRGLVLRLPQAVGKTNNLHPLINFLRNHIISGKHFTVWASTERNLIDIDDVARIGAKLAIELPTEATAVSIVATRSQPMPGIIRVSNVTLAKPRIAHTSKRYAYGRRHLVVEILSRRMGIDLGSNCIERVIDKYYAIDQRRDVSETLPTAASNT